MENLFYSQSEKENRLFYIPNYYLDNIGEIDKFVEHLKNEAQKLADVAKVNVNKVSSIYITSSCRYKYMRVFYIDLPKNKKVENAFCLGKDWSMWQWCTN